MTLAEVRKEIDRVDSGIKQLFEERMILADNVARVKAETGDEIFKPDREIAIIENLTEDVDDSIKKEYTALIKRIMEISRKYQYGRTLNLRDCLKIDYLEEMPSVEKVAMIKGERYIYDIIPDMTPDSATIISVDDHARMGELVKSGEVDAGIGIMESVSVSVSNEIHSLLAEYGFFINSCKVVFDSGIRKKVVMFTKNMVVLPEHNRMKFMFICHNRSGALASILSMISDYGVNLTEIHSHPNHAEEWNYEFYAEIEANFLEEETKALIFQLMNETEKFVILGSYRCEGDFVKYVSEPER